VEALGRAQVRPKDIAAVGITNQRETTIVWDRDTGVPIHNAIVWQDRRTADYCERLKADGAGELIQARTGLLIDAYFSASKIRWLLDNVAGARARADAGKLAFGTVDSWLVWKLTNHAPPRHRRQQRVADHAVQHPHAEVTKSALFGIPASMLPDLRSSSEIYGEVSTELASKACRSPASRATNRRRSSARCAEARCRRTPTAPAVSRCRTSARRRRAAAAAGDDGGVAAQRANRLRARGQRVHRRRRRPGIRDGLGFIRTAADIEPLAATVP
jgi:hypothetical protein